jgi:sialic acid synthase SpsE
MDEFSLRERRTGLSPGLFIIAEKSGNHNQSLERAMEIVNAAAASGAHGRNWESP